jgi:hypothetical protein
VFLTGSWCESWRILAFFHLLEEQTWHGFTHKTRISGSFHQGFEQFLYLGHFLEEPLARQEGGKESDSAGKTTNLIHNNSLLLSYLFFLVVMLWSWCSYLSSLLVVRYYPCSPTPWSNRLRQNHIILAKVVHDAQNVLYCLLPLPLVNTGARLKLYLVLVSKIPYTLPTTSLSRKEARPSIQKKRRYVGQVSTCSSLLASKSNHVATAVNLHYNRYIERHR